MPERDQVDVYGGVDTHSDTHVGAVLDHTGRLLGSEEFRADAAGYAQLERWLRAWGRRFRSVWKDAAVTAPGQLVIWHEPTSR